MHLLLLMAIPVVTGVLGFFLGKRRITPNEAGIQIVVVLVLMIGGYQFTRWTGIQDYEVWSGRIADKDSGSGGCCHSYDCNCRTECNTDSNGTETCGEVCDTCYEHSYDDWYSATSTNDEQVYYSGCYPPAASVPASWSSIRIGEPTAHEHRYTNYVMADPGALIDMERDLSRFDDTLPEYPEVRGFRIERFLFVGIDESVVLLDTELDELNADLGARKQVNVIVVVTAEEDPAWFDALVVSWLGGNKNDVVLVIGAPAYPDIAWARVMAWNKAGGLEDEFRGSLVARVMRLERFDGSSVLSILRDEVSRNYRRRPFAEFRYLMARARPSRLSMTLLILLGLVLSVFLQYRFWKNDKRMSQSPPSWVGDRWREVRGRWKEWRASR